MTEHDQYCKYDPNLLEKVYVRKRLTKRQEEGYLRAGLFPGRESGSSLQSCRKRSIRALLWSGPCPSSPWGSIMTIAVACPHLSSAAPSHLASSHDHPLWHWYIYVCTMLRAASSVSVSPDPRAIPGTRHVASQCHKSTTGKFARGSCLKTNGRWVSLGAPSGSKRHRC